MIRVAGFGARAGASLDSLRAAYGATGASGITALATIQARADLVRPLAAELGLPLQVVAVAGVATPTRSARVQASFQTGSVAEAAALIAAGPGAQLAVLRVSAPDGMATCAVAIGKGDDP